MRRHWDPSIVRARRKVREIIAAQNLSLSAANSTKQLTSGRSFSFQREDVKIDKEREISETTWLFDKNLRHYVRKKMRYIDGRRAQTQVLE